MKAWLLNAIEGLGALTFTETPAPTPGPGEALLRMDYAALNPADRYLAEGHYPAHPPMPHILGRDGVGSVVAVGEGVTSVRVGDRKTILRGEVGVNRWGTFAEQAVVPVESLVDSPAGWTEPQAASAALVYLTAHQALTQWGELAPMAVLVTGASGGVGVASLQLGRAMGHTMLALSRGTEKKEQLLSIGAHAVFDPTDPTWKKQLRTYLGKKRVGLAIDNIGGDLFPHVIDTLDQWGKVSVVGRLAGPTPEFNTSTLLFRRIRIGGVAVGTYTNQESHTAWDSVVATMNRNNLKPIVDSVFAMGELPKAFERLKAGPIGKVLISMVKPSAKA